MPEPNCGRWHPSRGGAVTARSAVVSLAAMGSVLAASSCCLPVLPFLAAAGFATASMVLSVARPFLSGISVLLIGYGFYRARRVKKCSGRASMLSSLLLWTSAAFVAMSLLFPQVMADAAANLLSR